MLLDLSEAVHAFLCGPKPRKSASSSLETLLVKLYGTTPGHVHIAVTAALRARGLNALQKEARSVWKVAATAAILVLASLPESQLHGSSIKDNLRESILWALFMAGRWHDTLSLLRAWDWKEELDVFQGKLSASILLLQQQPGLYFPSGFPVQKMPLVETLGEAMRMRCVGPVERLLEERRELLLKSFN